LIAKHLNIEVLKRALMRDLFRGQVRVTSQLEAVAV
jgi:hypothetical protein